MILFDETRAFRSWYLLHALSHIVQQAFSFHRHKIGIWEIAVVVGELFCAHEKGFASHIVPSTRLLLEFFAALQDADLTPDLVSKGATHAANRVHVFYLNFCS